MRILSLLALVAAVCVPGVVRADAPGKVHDVEVTRGLTYHEVPDDPDAYRHQLDVYRPKGKKDCPVLLLLHGGGWVAGSKDDVFGVYGYGTIARDFAKRGLVVVVPNYRLSPGVRHPEHIKDVARAFAWTRANVGTYGGDKKQLFVGGHSAGGHLAALLATDDKYLKEVGRKRADIRGVVAVSGVYRLEDLDLRLSVADAGGRFRLDVHARPFALPFGDDPEMVRQASPLTHVRKGLPPFLILSAGFDYPPLRSMARDFTAALKKEGCDVRLRVMPWRTHETLLFDIAHLSADTATADAVLEFIDGHKAR
jgi:acetyl esterase/lipase